MNENSLLLLDGNSIINRAYFALAGRRPMTAPDGTPTGALYGFVSIYLKYLGELDPDHVCIAFDRKEPTFRHVRYDQYKATRKGMPDDLAVQMPLIKQILGHMGVKTVELAGYEADDLLGTLAKRAAASDMDVFIVSGDRDGLQLVDDRIRLILPLTRGGQSTSETYGPDAVMDRYGVTPAQLIEVKALMGDSSDNVPGVRGIGEKGALSLISEYGSLEGVYDALDEIRPTVAKKLEESRDLAYLSRDLVRIDCGAPLDAELSAMTRGEPDGAALGPLLERLGMRSTAVRLNAVAPTPSERESKAQVLDIKKETPLNRVWQDVFQTPAPVIAVASAGDGLVITADGSAVYPIGPDAVPELLSRCADKDALLAGYELKNQIKRHACDWSGVRMHDMLIAAYLLSHLDGKPDFERIYEAGTGKPLTGWQPQTVQNRQTDLLGMADEAAKDDSDRPARMAAAIHETAIAQRTLLEERSMIRLADDIEMPLIRVLADMEKTGIYVDDAILKQLSVEFQTRITALEGQIHELCGVEFNINSPKQLSEVLFGTLGLPGGKKNANGSYSTGADEMDRLTLLHPAITLILEFRQLAKLRSTFVEGLSKVIDPADGRVHTTFNQAVTATGRLSSTEPNLQNIPVRATVGREIRKSFTAAPGWILLDADYSQIELRLLAHLSGDPAMTKAFLEGEDIHTKTAGKIFNVPADEVTQDMRAAAKTVNFSIVYGISGFGLAKDLGISVVEAQRYIDEYYDEYAGVKTYLEGIVADAYETGYVETLFGRRRFLPELKVTNRNIRNFGERAAMNTPVQGTAADIMKLAMIRVAGDYRKEGLEARLVLQVHDELIVECRPGEADQASFLLQKGMEEAVKLDIPLVAEVSQGDNWFETK